MMPTDWEALPPSELARQVGDMVNRGQLRSQIPCGELRARWFEMARDVYVAGIRRAVPGDVEIGMHLGQCQEPACRLLDLAYWMLLRPSRPEDAAGLAGALDALERKVADL